MLAPLTGPDAPVSEEMQNGSRAYTLLDNISDGFFVIDSQGIVVFWNRTAAKIFSCPKAIITGRPLWDFCQQSVREAILQPVERAFSSANPVRAKVFYPEHQLWYDVQCQNHSGEVAVHFKKTAQQQPGPESAKQSNTKLRLTSEQLSTILDNSSDMICAVNSDGIYVQMNAACLPVLGYTPEELLGTSWENTVLADDLKFTRAELERGKYDLQTKRFSNRQITKDKKVIVIEWSCRWDADKQTLYAAGRDITAVIEAKKLRNQNEARIKALLRRGTDIIAILDKNGKYQFISDNVSKIMGLDAPALLGQSALNFIHPEDLELVRKKIVNIICYNEHEKAELRVRHSDGSWKWFEINAANYLDDPAINGVVINSRDITQRRLRQQQLQASNERYQRILDIANEILWEWDFATGLVYKNRNYENIFGYGSAPHTVDVWIARIHPEDRQRVYDSLIQNVNANSESVWHQEYRLIQKNGEIAYISDRGVLVRNNDGQAVKMVGSMHDITLRKKDEREREAIIETLVQNNEDLRQFSFITSHNLRAPLSNILGILDLINPATLPEDQQHLLDLLKSSSLQLRETIDDLTQVIVIRNRVATADEPLYFEDVLKQIRQAYLDTLYDIPVVVHSDFALPSAQLHKPYIESVFINLISNAVKYRDVTRTLELRICSRLTPTGWCELTFSDNGMGMDMDKIATRLFGMYQQFHHQADGKGLGLFMVKAQIQGMGGSISVDSVPGEGTTFTILLPIQ